MAYGTVNVPGVSGPELESVRTLAQSAKADASSALDTAKKASKTADDAQAEASAAKQTAENAAAGVASAQQKADDAASAAASAAAAAAAAQTAANAAKQSSQAAETAAQNAQTAADAALKKITEIASSINTVPTQSGTLSYTGSAQSPTWNSYDPNVLTIGGTTSGTNAGNYSATFTPKQGYQWADGTTTAKTVTWTINRATVAVPSQSGSLAYNGSSRTPTWSGYDTNKMSIGGNTSGTNAGTYAATFTPKSNYQWPDGSTGAKSVNWTISRAAGSLSLGTTSLSLDVSGLTGNIAVTRAGDGAISASSSNTAVATASVSGTNVVVTGKKAGTATITVSVAQGTNYNAPANKTCSVTVTMPTTTLNDNAWSTIKQASDGGNAANYWAVGDTKTITINGKVGNFTFSNLSVQAFILGFNHNSAKEGNNRIHFQIGKISGKMVGLCDSKYNNQGGTGYFNMNTTNTNVGGWKDSYMRKTLLGNSNTPTSPLANSLMAALPSDLRSNMKSVSKYTDNVGNATGHVAGNVTATTDYLFLLSNFEVQGSDGYANNTEKNSQKQYDYYKAGNSKIAYNHSSTSSAVWWWLRSPNYNNTDLFCLVNTDGTYTNLLCLLLGGAAALITTPTVISAMSTPTAPTTTTTPHPCLLLGGAAARLCCLILRRAIPISSRPRKRAVPR